MQYQPDHRDGGETEGKERGGTLDFSQLSGSKGIRKNAPGDLSETNIVWTVTAGALVLTSGGFL